MSLLLAMMLQAVVAPPPVDTAALQAQLQSAQTTSANAKAAADQANSQAATAIANAAAVQSQLQAAQTAAASAKTAADAAAASAATATSTASTATTTANAAATKADAAATAMTAAVKTVNGISPTNGAVSVALPTASTNMPPCITDLGSTGTAGTMIFAPWNHTHCSKARRIIATTATDGSYTFDYSAAPFVNPPVCTVTPRVAAVSNEIYSGMIVGDATTTQAKVLIGRATRTPNALLNLTVVVAVPQASTGATRVDIICIEA